MLGRWGSRLSRVDGKILPVTVFTITLRMYDYH